MSTNFQKMLSQSRAVREEKKKAVKEEVLALQMLPYDYPILFPYNTVIQKVVFATKEEAMLGISLLLGDGTIMGKNVEVTKDSPRVVGLEIEVALGDLLTITWSGSTPPRLTLVVGCKE